MSNSATNGNQFKNGNILLSEIYQIDPSKLNVNPLNSYFNYDNAEIEILKADINNRGIIVPIIIKDDYTIISGHKRVKVALALNFITVPVQRIISEITPETERELFFKDNILRRQLRYKDKKELINNLYQDEISLDHRGSYLKNQKLKSKNSVEYYIPLHIRIEKELGIPKGTALRILADIRKEKLELEKPNSNLKKLTKYLSSLERLLSLQDKEFKNLAKKQIMEFIKYI